MEDSGSTRKKRGGRYCVAGAPNKTSCKNSLNMDGISKHQFPKDLVIRKNGQNLYKHVASILMSCVTQSTLLCSVHFKESCYMRKISLNLENFQT